MNAIFGRQRLPLWSSGRYFLLLIAVLSGACTMAPPQPLAGTPWNARQQALSALQNWSLTGRIGITTASEGWHGSLRWVQERQTYLIDIVGPLGQGRINIRGDADSVTVRTADGRELSASDAEQLVLDATGLRIPIDGLVYWVRGLPDPRSASVLLGDEQGRLTRLEQDGWVIDFTSYQDVAALALPERISARQDDLQVKLVIRQWTL